MFSLLLLLIIWIPASEPSLISYHQKNGEKSKQLIEVYKLYEDCLNNISGEFNENLVILLRTNEIYEIRSAIMKGPLHVLASDLWRTQGIDISKRGTFLVISKKPIPSILRRIPWSDTSHFIVLATKEDSNQLLHDFWDERILNVVVLEMVGKSIDVLTYTPYAAKSCGQIHVKKLTSWNRTHSIQTNLFINKVKDLQLCPIRITLLERPPSAYLSKNGVFTGVEVEILKLVSNALNATPIFEFLHEKKWLTRARHSVFNLLMTDLIERHGDIAAGQLMFTRSVYLFSEAVDYSDNICVTFAVPRTTQTASNLLKFFETRSSYLGTLASGTLISLASYLFFKRTQYSYPLYRAFTFVSSPLFSSAIKAPKELVLRFGFGLWFLNCFFFLKDFETYVSSSVLAPHTLPQMETMNNVFNSQLVIAGETFFMNELMPMFIAEGKSSSIVYTRMPVEEAVARIARDGNIAYLGAERTLLYTILQNSGAQEHVYVQKECGTSYSPVIQTAKNSPYLEELTKRVRALTEFGISKRLFSKFSEEMEKDVENQMPGSNFKPLTFKDLVSAFRMVGGGWLIAIVVFVFEVFLHKSILLGKIIYAIYKPQ